VNYQVKEKPTDKNSKWFDKSVEFNIPFASKADRFYVSDTPFVTALSELQGINAKKQALTKQTQDYTESEVKKFGTFLEAFFT
ncbi:conjugal transfer protein, partial [Lactococcus raffinolactis]